MSGHFHGYFQAWCMLVTGMQVDSDNSQPNYDLNPAQFGENQKPNTHVQW